MDKLIDDFERYYAKCFAEHGALARGVDWHDADSLAFHYDKILEVIEPDMSGKRVSVLDVGCGYGGLLNRAQERGLDLDYTGLDLVEASIAHGRARYPEAVFHNGDFFAFDPGRRFDYVLANGLLTEKLGASLKDFGQFARAAIRRMFALADRGVAFNMMTSAVNYYASNLYYQNPADMIAFCMGELSCKWRIDHSYRYYDFTMYVYRER